MHTHTCICGAPNQSINRRRETKKKLVLVYFIMDDGMTELQNWTTNQAHTHISFSLHCREEKIHRKRMVFSIVSAYVISAVFLNQTDRSVNRIIIIFGPIKRRKKNIEKIIWKIPFVKHTHKRGRHSNERECWFGHLFWLKKHVRVRFYIRSFSVIYSLFFWVHLNHNGTCHYLLMIFETFFFKFWFGFLSSVSTQIHLIKVTKFHITVIF